MKKTYLDFECQHPLCFNILEDNKRFNVIHEKGHTTKCCMKLCRDCREVENYFWHTVVEVKN
tara:strand:+ start:778 stop:963 length:186 start_codon:yes stop_codon:yes gene_type:complete